ncbi:hypothetical protein SMC26_39565 [Actinomadura fulvescens]|uniref:Uncharacterized protein n=1 Tax=Actinomadura fulvescens TaxID=46160 RepID=A0ABN3Q321_9ACTN
MKRIPTLDQSEHGHTTETAYLSGDVDALDVIDTAVLEWAREMAEEA